MKRALLLPLAAIVSLLTAAPALAYQNGAPTLKCFDCHVPVGDHQSMLQVEGIPKEFRPGKTYQISLTVQSDIASLGSVLGGFAVQVSAGELIVTDQFNTQVSDHILTHTLAGAAQRSWKLAWKAPKESREVDIVVMATAANGDFAPLGDSVVAQSFPVRSR